MDSILLSTKKSLGLAASYTAFDPDVIMHINSVMLDLNQLGLGPTGGFVITGEDELWTDFIGARKDLVAVQSLTYLKVRLLFDPPQTSFVIDSINKQIEKFEWRLMVQAEPMTIPEEVITSEE
mgnify:CR=1 FL=1